MKRAGLTLLCGLILTGCQMEKEDLETFVSRTNAAAKATATQIPSMPEYQPVVFSIDSRQPFALPAIPITNEVSSDDCWQPNLERRRQKLERYEMDSLAMKGVIGGKSGLWALIEVPSGEVVKVGHGQYIGSNLGVIEAIDSNNVVIEETLPDGLGCWQTRKVKLALN